MPKVHTSSYGHSASIMESHYVHMQLKHIDHRTSDNSIME